MILPPKENTDPRHFYMDKHLQMEYLGPTVTSFLSLLIHTPPIKVIPNHTPLLWSRLSLKGPFSFLPWFYVTPFLSFFPTSATPSLTFQSCLFYYKSYSLVAISSFLFFPFPDLFDAFFRHQLPSIAFAPALDCQKLLTCSFSPFPE